MLTKKHLVGVAASMGLFAMFGVFIGVIVGIFGGVGFSDSIDGFVTGSTTLYLDDLVSPFGLTLNAVGLEPGSRIVLPAVPYVTIELGGTTIDLMSMSLGTASLAGGAAVGFGVGMYYAIDIAWEQWREAA